jgi:penicillin-binding protein 2
VENIETALSNVAKTVGMPSPLDRRAIRRHINQTLAMPLVAWRDVGEKELARFCEHDRELPGFSVLETEERVYPQGRLASHLIGYVGRDRGESEAGDEKFNFYLPEMRGRSGLEIYYDSFLRGVSGERKVLVDARGFAIREWTVVEPKRGPDLRISLDVRVQRAAEGELRGLKGACVVLDPRNS